jgi:hypothetical protein
MLADRDRRNLDEAYHGGSTQTVAGASVGVANTALEIDVASSSLRDRSYNEHDTASAKAGDL